MVIDNLHVVSISVPPHKTYPKLIVDSDAVLSDALPAKRLQVIPRRHLHVERDRWFKIASFLNALCTRSAGSQRLLPTCQSLSASLSWKLATISLSLC